VAVPIAADPAGNLSRPVIAGLRVLDRQETAASDRNGGQCRT
jgi:hypothetical protein